MKPSSFQVTIENQFDYICKKAIEDERKDYFKYLSRLALLLLGNKQKIIQFCVGTWIIFSYGLTPQAISKQIKKNPPIRLMGQLRPLWHWIER